MIYRSNLEAPDFSAAFPFLHVRPMPHSFGHSVPSDWADKAIDDPVFGLYKKCGMLTHDEGAILYNIALRRPGLWLDVGSHTGWSTVHLGKTAIGIDPMYGVTEFLDRAKSNLRRAEGFPVTAWGTFFVDATSRVFFKSARFPASLWHDNLIPFSGVMIDGDHSDGEPQHDAIEALKFLANDGVIVFHDFIGRPVREGVQYLMSQGLKSRVYLTPHMMAVCWRGDFEPPDHEHDPKLGFLRNQIPDFDLGRCA